MSEQKSIASELGIEGLDQLLTPQEPVVIPVEQQINTLVGEIITIQARLDAIKPLYEEMEKKVLELKNLVGLDKQVIENGTQIGVTIVDNFAEKNTVFRVTGVKRFEASLETLEDRMKKAEKEAKKAEKLAKALAKGE